MKHLSIGLLLLCVNLSQGKPDKQRPDDPRLHDNLSGFWKGDFSYPKESDKQEVKFELVLVQEGAMLVGFIKEPNTFGKRKEPWLHSRCIGRINEKTGKMTLTKTYDGTAGEDCVVEVQGELARDDKKVAGSWTLGDVNGKFKLVKETQARSKAFTGLWAGAYHYPGGNNQNPVHFTMFVIQDGQKIHGLIKERNTFGNKEEPWLHATFDGTLDEKTGKVNFTKTYDGTAGVEHAVEYSGDLNDNKASASGNWSIGGNEGGEFTLQKQRLKGKTLESLK